MPIKVNISISAGGRFKPVSSHTLHEKRITIGRDAECTLALEDTQKHVSRTHAEFEEKDGGYRLKVVSKVNPVVLNGKRLMSGDTAALADGDHISIGLYKLEIVEARVAPARVEPPKHAAERPEDITYVARRSDFPSRTPPPPPEPPPGFPEGSEEATFVPTPKRAPPPPLPPNTDPPPASLPESAAMAEEATYVPPVKAAPLPPPPPPAPAAPPPKTALPDAAFADDEVTYIPPMWARPPSSGAVQDDAAHGADDTSEDMTNFRRPVIDAAHPQPPAAPVSDAPAPVAAEAPAALDLDLDLSDAFSEEETSVRTPPQAEAPAEPDFSEDQTYVRRPPPKPAEPAPAPAAPSPGPAYTDADRLAEEETQYRSPVPEIGPRKATVPAAPGTDRAVQAFLEGAGLTNLSIADAESFMRESGSMVRAAVEGIMMMLLARAEARKELGAEIDNGTGDNPVTSMASPAEVLAFLFDPKRPSIGDTNPVQAFSEACADLRAHQVALVAGMRAAVMSALLRIDPKKIEREHGVNLGGLNLTRKSKLWDISVTQHEQLAREMETNFNSVFGPEILAAYTAQVRKMRGGQ